MLRSSNFLSLMKSVNKKEKKTETPVVNEEKKQNSQPKKEIKTNSLPKPELNQLSIRKKETIPQKKIVNDFSSNPSAFYGNGKSENKNTNLPSSSQHSHVSSINIKRQKYEDRDYSVLSSPIRAPPKDNYLPFSHAISRININEKTEQGTRFIIKNGDPSVVLKLICVSEPGDYVLFNPAEDTVTWRKPYEVEEIGGPIYDCD